MSLPEPTPRSQPPMSSKPVPKPRPPIPNKRSHNGSDCPTVPQKSSETKSLQGKVKRIVSKFSEQECMARGGNTEGVMVKRRGPKRAPTIKPKPKQIPQTGEQAPPLPVKMSRRATRKEKEANDVVPKQEESMIISVRDEGSRSGN